MQCWRWWQNPLHVMNATYALYFVIRCQLLPGVLLSRHLDRGLIQRFNFQRDCAIHKTATIWGLMLKYFLSFKSIFCQAKIQAEKDAEIQATGYLSFAFFLSEAVEASLCYFLKTGWWNSNFQTSGIYKYFQEKSNLHISICQRHFKRNISMWKTLYFHNHM